MNTRLQIGTLFVVAFISAAHVVADDHSNISSDEDVVLFATSAAFDREKSTWTVPIHGWIFEPEETDPVRQAIVGRLVTSLNRTEAAPDDEALRICETRVRQFLVDNERGKRIVVRAADETFSLEPSGRDGHFFGEISIPADKAAAHAKDGWLTFEVVMPESDERVFRGSAQLVEPQGIHVISDIDDTVKVSEVTDKAKLLQNTFFREFKAVEGMSDVYRSWQKQHAAFAFVSGSPWQLYRPLSEFLANEHFPGASFHLKRFSLKDPSVANLLDEPDEHKLKEIGDLLSRFRGRRFVLVGDSGERDPEIYGKVAREHAEQVIQVFIRRVTPEEATDERYAKAFEGVPAEKWHLFEKADELPERID